MTSTHTHVVSLFLPNTLDFHDDQEEARPFSPTPLVDKRKSSTIDLTKRASTTSLSATSLFHSSNPPLTPKAESEEFFAHFALESQKRHFAKPGDPRSLVRSDVEVPVWGREQIFNQPRSRAGPLPSGSVLDFAQWQEEQKPKGAKRMRVSFGSRNTSSERNYGSQVWTVEPALHGNGGLTNAMRAVAGSGDMDISWIGTLGFPTDALPQETKEQIHDKLANEYQSDVVYVSDKDMDRHYVAYCKTILWPIFHYQVPDHPKSKAYADQSWEYYRNVNQALADRVVDNYRRGDIIWVHDYHLLLVPGMVRKKLPDAQIGFFLHTAFPSSEIFRVLSTRKELLEGMLGANLVAFQVEEYANHFLQTCSRLLTVETTIEGVQLEDHFVNVTYQPIGIDPSALEEARQAEEVKQWIETIQERYKDQVLIVARDKLDYVHGVRQKLLAYELFLNKYPEWSGKTCMIQIATSTSEQIELFTTVSDICTRIDNQHSSLVHQPLIFLKQDMDFSQYLALLSVADVLMVSSLRDGMNLTPHEFVTCQDGRSDGKKHAPVILSEFAGSAAVFHDHIPINPWDYHMQADAIKAALEMGDREKEYRWQGMKRIVAQQTGGHWAKELSKSLTKVHEEHNMRSPIAVPRLSTPQVSEKYKQAKQRVFMLDYEGTLAAHRTNRGVPLASPARVVETLNDLMSDPKNIVYVMSNRTPHDMESVFRTASGLGFIAENGCIIRGHGTAPDQWKSYVDLKQVSLWKKDVMFILKNYTSSMEGSYVEERTCSLLFHYEKVDDQDTATRRAGECADQINMACQTMGIQAVPIAKAVLIEHTNLSKATATADIFDELCSTTEGDTALKPDFLMVAGDDREDEVVFRWANELAKQRAIKDAFTVSVGKRNTEAQAALTQGSSGLLTLLQKLAKISIDEMPADYFGRASRAGN